MTVKIMNTRTSTYTVIKKLSALSQSQPRNSHGHVTKLSTSK